MRGSEETSMQHEERSDAPVALPASPERRRPVAIWQRLRQKIREAAFSPEWMASPWNSLAVGYGAALVLPVALVCLTWFLLHVFPMYALPGIPPPACNAYGSAAVGKRTRSACYAGGGA